MILYTLIYTNEEDKTIRMLFNSETKRSAYIESHNITNYTLGEVNVTNVVSNE